MYSILAAYNPRPRLTLNPGVIGLGSSADLDWSFDGSVKRISRCRIWLIGIEYAMYGSGTNTVTTDSTFEKLLLADETNEANIRHGHTRVTVPGFTMHSSKAHSNQVIWTIRVECDITRRPTLERSSN